MLPFERSEYLGRVAATKRRMEAAGIEVQLVSDPCNMNHLTGYDATSYYVHQMVAIALDAQEPLWIGREMDIACARFTTFLQPENMRGYPESFIGVPDRHPMEFVATTLTEMGWDRRRIGVEMDAHFFSARCYTELVNRLPGAAFVDASLLVNWVRIVKSPREIAYMRQARHGARLPPPTASRNRRGLATPSALATQGRAGTSARPACSRGTRPSWSRI